MSKPQTLEQAARKYAARVEYRKRISRLVRRCKCHREEEVEYDGYMRVTYPGAPSCYDMEILYEENYADLPDPFSDTPLATERSPTDKAWKDWYERHREAREGRIWCSRCLRRNKLVEVRRSAYASERNSLRALLNAANRESGE